MDERPQQPVQIHIGIGTRDGAIHDECVASLLSVWSRFPCSITFMRGPYIGRNRDVVTAEALARDDVTHVLYIDSDVTFGADDVNALLELGVDFAFGRYAFKTIEGPKAGAPVARSRVGWGTVDDVTVLEYDRVGAGFVLVRRDAIERMVACYAIELGYTDPGGRQLHGLWWQSGYTQNEAGQRIVEGEDYAFCRRWRDIGGRIFTRDDVKLGHVGLHKFTLD